MNFLLSPKKLQLDKLPTKLDVLRGFVYEIEKWKEKHKTKQNPGSSLIADILTEKIQRIYHNADIKPLRKDKIKEKIQKVYSSRMNLLKIRRIVRYSKMYAKKEEEYLACLAHPLDVVDKGHNARKGHKAALKTIIEKSSWHDEITLNSKREAAVLSRQKSYAVITNDENEGITETENNNDSDYQPQCADNTTKRKNLSGIIEIKSRYSFSDRGTSAIVNATLKAFDIPTIIDKSKLGRAQKRKFAEVDSYPIAFGGGLYYDSRKDQTIIQTKKIDESGKLKFYRTIRREDHYSFVSEPIGVFLGFIGYES